jgi:hypothetical protein
MRTADRPPACTRRRSAPREFRLGAWLLWLYVAVVVSVVPLTDIQLVQLSTPNCTGEAVRTPDTRRSHTGRHLGFLVTVPTVRRCVRDGLGHNMSSF